MMRLKLAYPLVDRFVVPPRDDRLVKGDSLIDSGTTSLPREAALPRPTRLTWRPPLRSVATARQAEFPAWPLGHHVTTWQPNLNHGGHGGTEKELKEDNLLRISVLSVVPKPINAFPLGKTLSRTLSRTLSIRFDTLLQFSQAFRQGSGQGSRQGKPGLGHSPTPKADEFGWK